MKGPKYVKFEQVVTYENLVKSYFHCRKGKAFRAVTVKYHMNYQTNLLRLLRELWAGTYKIKGLYNFVIYEPKKRNITANQFEDKIVQRLVCKYALEPVMANRLVFDNYASQPGKGTHLAVKRLQGFMADFAKSNGWTDEGYVLVADIKKFFYTIDRTICNKQVQGLPIDQKLKDLVEMQIYAYESQYNEYTDDPNKGVCIGFQTSQWLAVYYLNKLDHLIKEKLHIKYFGRYMDDLYLIHKDREYLEYCLKVIKEFVENELNLELNKKTHIHPFSQGICFLGYHCTFNCRTHKIDTAIRKKSLKRLYRRAKRQQVLIGMDRITRQAADSSLQSWYAYAQYGLTEQAENAYHSIKDQIFPMAYEWDCFAKELENPDKVDKDGFYILWPKPPYVDHAGFTRLIPVKETLRQYQWRTDTEYIIDNADLFAQVNLDFLLNFKGRYQHQRQPTKKRKTINCNETMISATELLFTDLIGGKKESKKARKAAEKKREKERIEYFGWKHLNKYRDEDGFVVLKRKEKTDD